MRDYIISTDNTCDLPLSLLQENNIDVHDLYYAFGDDVYGGEKTMPLKEFYNKMHNGAMPTTMAANPAEIEKKFEATVSKGYDILHIAFSSALSGSYNAYQIASREVLERHPEAKIIIIDSLAASMGEGLIVTEALRLKNTGKSMLEVSKHIENFKHNACHQFTVNDLNHLQRGGRISKATAIIGSLVNIKPVLRVDEEGRLVPLSKVRGRKKALSTLVDNMETKMGLFKSMNKTVLISHSDCIEDAQIVANDIKNRFGFEVIINDICPTIGAHTGPGTIALFYWAETR